MARAVPLSLTQLHTTAVSRFRADPLVVDQFSLDVLFAVSRLAVRWAQPRGVLCVWWPGRTFMEALCSAEGR